MVKTKILNVVTVILVSIFTSMGTFMVASSAYAAGDNSYVQEATQALQDTPVFIESSVNGFNYETLVTAAGGAKIAVVVLPEIAFNTFSAGQTASMILALVPQYDTLLLARDTGQPRILVASNTHLTDKNSIVSNLLKANPGDTSTALTNSVVEIKNFTSTTNQPPTEGKKTDGDSMSRIVAIMLIVMVLVGITVLLLTMFGPKSPAKGEKTEVKVDTRFGSFVPENISSELRKLNETRKTYMNIGLDDMSNQIGKLINHTQELFKRLDKSGAVSQKLMAEVEYVDRFNKLNTALGEQYYIDYVNHPDLWNDVRTRKTNVETALTRMQEQVLQNIREVNASQDINIKVMLDSLLRENDPNKVKNLYKDSKTNEKEEEF